MNKSSLSYFMFIALTATAFFTMMNPLLAASYKIVAFGDSLTAGYGVKIEEAFPTVLKKKLGELGYDVEVINAGVSGDTTAGGKARLPRVVGEKPRLVILALGANDMFRAKKPEEVYQNLKYIIDELKKNNARVILAGMKAPINMGPDYASKFNGVFPKLASESKIELIPFFLEGVAGDPKYNLKDGIHPNPQGIEIMASTILPQVMKVLKEEGIKPGK